MNVRSTAYVYLLHALGRNPAGEAHATADDASAGFVGSPLPVVGLMIVGGIVAGVIVHRTGSLALPVALHVAVDVPPYYGTACLAA